MALGVKQRARLSLLLRKTSGKSLVTLIYLNFTCLAVKFIPMARRNCIFTFKNVDCQSEERWVLVRKYTTNRMRGITLSCLQKSFVNSKAFGVRLLRTYLLNII